MKSTKNFKKDFIFLGVSSIMVCNIRRIEQASDYVSYDRMFTEDFVMNELYAEAGAKRKADAKTFMLKFLMIFAVVILFAAGMLLANQILFFVATIAIVFVVFLMPRFKVEYEYIFCDGQFDFDKIMGGQRRKTMLKIDMENAEVLAPVKSHALDGYTYQKLAVKDFTSGAKESEGKVYAIVGKATVGKGKTKSMEMVKVLFEPSDKMLACAKQKSPRKVMEY